MLLVYRSVPVVISVLCPRITTISAGKTRITPCRPCPSWGKSCKVGVDPDRHNRCFATAIHNFGIGECRWACNPLQPNKRIRSSFGPLLGRCVRCEIVSRVGSVGLRRMLRPKKFARPAGSNAIHKFDLERILRSSRILLARWIVGHGLAPWPRGG